MDTLHVARTLRSSIVRDGNINAYTRPISGHYLTLIKPYTHPTHTLQPQSSIRYKLTVKLSYLLFTWHWYHITSYLAWHSIPKRLRCQALADISHRSYRLQQWLDASSGRVTRVLALDLASFARVTHTKRRQVRVNVVIAAKRVENGRTHSSRSLVF